MIPTIGTISQQLRAGRGTRSLWIGIVGTPLLWLVHFQATYMLVPYSCIRGSFTLMHAETAASLVLTLVAGWLCWRDWQVAGQPWPASEAAGRPARAGFLPVLALMVTGLFALVILAQWIPTFFIDPCHQ